MRVLAEFPTALNGPHDLNDSVADTVNLVVQEHGRVGVADNEVEGVSNRPYRACTIRHVYLSRSVKKCWKRRENRGFCLRESRIGGAFGGRWFCTRAKAGLHVNPFQGRLSMSIRVRRPCALPNPLTPSVTSATRASTPLKFSGIPILPHPNGFEL